MKKWIFTFIVVALFVAANSSKIIGEEIASNFYGHLFVVMAMSLGITGIIYWIYDALLDAFSGKARPRRR